MIDFFTGDNWIRNLAILLSSIGILIFAGLNYNNNRKRKHGKWSKVKDSKQVNITQTGDSESEVEGSEDVTINQ